MCKNPYRISQQKKSKFNIFKKMHLQGLAFKVADILILKTLIIIQTKAARLYYLLREFA